MKSILLTAFLLFLTFPRLSEETLISGEVESGGYGGPVVKFTQFNDDLGVMVGGEGGWIINHQFVLGGGGYGMTTRHEISIDDEEYNIDMGYGGGLVRYIIKSDDIVHYDISTMFAGGGVNISKEAPGDDIGTTSIETDEFFVLDPSVHVVINFTEWFRLGFGMGYRQTFGYESEYLEESKLNGAHAAITFKFGEF